MGKFRTSGPQVLGHPGCNIAQGRGGGSLGTYPPIHPEVTVVFFEKAGCPPGGANINSESGTGIPPGTFYGIPANRNGVKDSLVQVFVCPLGVL